MTSKPKYRRRHARAATKKQHLPPGSATYAGDLSDDVPVGVRVVDFDADRVDERDAHSSADLAPLRDSTSVTWVNLDGVHKAGQIQAIGRVFGLHPLWIEDILNPSSRPKAEAIDDKVLLVARMARPSEDPTSPVATEQVVLVLGPTWVLTFQERPGDVWDPLQHRIRTGGGRVRKMQADYLLHALLDSIVDNYFLALEALDAQVDTLEDAAMGGQAVELARIHAMRGELSRFRNVVWPMREAVAALMKRDSTAIASDTVPYFRDLYDHVVQVMDILESSRERLVGVFELHLAVNGHQLNQIMRVLTVVSTVFIPLTFIAGIYGMNFKWMPELELACGYPVVMALMVAIAAAMAAWFRTRQWM